MAHRRYRIIFSGRVQGVGFRYTTCRVAEGFRVSGWVRNEPDGTVCCVAEGESGELDAFLAGVKTAMDRYLSETTIDETEACGDLVGFTVRYA